MSELFRRARQLTPDDRDRFLAEQCFGDTSLEAEVRSLLDQDDVTRSPLDRPALFAAAVGDLANDATEPPEQIERYKLLQRIGEGGFGSVWMADQIEPMKRRVAVKIIKLGMDTRQVIARFEAERQALALMDHPNIARVLDAGATRSGRPFFVMELVNGEPITTYCDRAAVGITGRLELFTQVCGAIHHAHQKGIIHRDIKPGNVLITLHDGVPVPKVIDFGIAKATDSELTQRTLFTEHRQMIGTPAYMSPEQAELSGLDIDTRSDIYSLGVLLYELLTGAPPFDSRSLLEAGYVEMIRIIREQEPPRPSTRLSATSPDSATARALRDTDPRKLAMSLRGDLDWIVMKCLEKDRRRRYDAATDLARDVEHYLNDRPVSASPPSRIYRLRKFVRRNRGFVGAAMTVAGAMALGAAGTTWGLFRALDERERADQEAARATSAAFRAEVRARELDQVADFQSEQLAGINVSMAAAQLREDLSRRVRAALDARSKLSEGQRELRWKGFESGLRGVDFVGATLKLFDEHVFARSMSAIEERFSDQPLVQARLFQSLATAMCELGLLDQALKPQSMAVDLRRMHLGPRDVETLKSIGAMGVLLDLRGDIPGAEAHYEEALEGFEETLGASHPDTLYSMSCLGVLLEIKGEHEAAEALQRSAMEGLVDALGRTDRKSVTAMNNLGIVLRRLNRLDEAEEVTRQAVEISREAYGREDPLTLTAISNLGVHLRSVGRYEEAEPLYRESMDTRRRILGNEHPETLTSIANMGVVLNALGRAAEAEPFYREALETRRRILGEHHRQTLAAASNMSAILRTLGRAEDAMEYALDAYDGSLALFGADHFQTLTAAANLASLQGALGRTQEAELLMRDTLERRRRLLGDGDRQTLISWSNLATLLQETGRLEEAERSAREAAEGAMRALPGSDPALAAFLAQHAEVLAQLNRFAEAERSGRAAYDASVACHGAEHPKTRTTITFMVDLYKRWLVTEPGAPIGSRDTEWNRLAEQTKPPTSTE